MSWNVGHIAEKNSKLVQISTLIVSILLTLMFAISHKFEAGIIDEGIKISDIEIIDVDITVQPDIKQSVEPTASKIPIAAEDDEEIEDDAEFEIPDTEFDASSLPPPPPSFAGGDDEIFDFFAIQEKPVMTDKARKNLSQYIFKNYPSLAKRSGVSGTVILQFICSKEGIPTKINIVKEKPKSMGFGEVAIKALEQTMFSPGMQRDKPVAVRMKLPIKFTTKSN
ncbi:MAG: energy transducer TonB [Candidatus Delongbacteria bacterium]|jgi:TonB family protein|nr:energy transducer TonB [Candidatus Delongbacteria bacterium]